MNFANMSPADRAKAGVLIGVIVVLVFFVAYTVIGTVIGKKPATARNNNKTNTASAQLTPGATPTPSVTPPANPAEAFPTEKAFAAGSKTSNLAKDPSLQMSVEDPFTPTAQKTAYNTEGIIAPPADPKKEEKPVVSFSPLPSPVFSQPGPFGNPNGNGGWGDPGTGSGGGSGTKVADLPPPPEPEIKLIGLVHGEPSVATIQIDGRILIARKGDALAKGYRLTDVYSDGVQIRHVKQFTTLRVGSIMNENSAKKD
jgi:hypothetical protein